jgi:ribosomal-protein-alanine N-acetyltransferase
MSTTAPPKIRRLSYADLPQVIAIERRAYPTPWSLAMFVLELSKPSGICLAAWREDEQGAEAMCGYLICSRFDVVWHVMNVSVDPDARRLGIATAMLRTLIEREVPDPLAQFTLEVRVSNHGAIALYESFGFLSVGTRKRYYQDDGEDALIMWRTPSTLQGRLDDVPAVGPVQPTSR